MNCLRFLVAVCLPFSLLAEGGESSLERLIEGNQRYVSGAISNKGSLKTKRDQLLSSQSPFAIILGCSDSRVPPEIVFDQSLGDIFVVRIAGNVVGLAEMDSILYAAEELHSSLIFVLGHEGCGAVKAFLDNSEDPDLADISSQLKAAVKQSKRVPGDLWMNAVKANVRLSVEKLKKQPVLQKLIKAKRLEIRGGYYELESGQVRLL